MLLELAILVCLILLNGGLAMSEFAIFSSRPARLKARGDRRSLQALQRAEDPGRFLSTVQIGITLVGVLFCAFSGATLGLRVSQALQDIGFASAMAQPLGVGSVAVAVTFLLPVVGELLPKQIALSNPEGIAARVAQVSPQAGIGNSAGICRNPSFGRSDTANNPRFSSALIGQVLPFGTARDAAVLLAQSRPRQSAQHEGWGDDQRMPLKQPKPTS